MSIGAFLLILAILIMVGLYLYAPFLGRRPRAGAQASPEISALMAERDRVITALRELDFDSQLGKIPAEDYPQQRAELLKKGADVLRRLDGLLPSPNGSEGAMEARIEKAAAARQTEAAAMYAEFNSDELENMIALRRKDRKEKAAGFCPRCGKPVLISDRFCPSCGKSLRTP